jgi:hypothetical protein
MAFRDDSDALHARIESLERELAEARGELEKLSNVVLERDRLQRELDLLRPKKPNRPPEPATPRGGSWGSSSTPKSNVGMRMALAAMIAVLALGLVTWILASSSSSSSVQRGFGTASSENKPPDTRPPSIGVVDLTSTPDPVPIAFTVTGTDEAPPGCSGYVPSAPQLVLRTSVPTLTTVTTRCGTDLVAVLSGTPAGLLCDDDGGQSNQPRIQTVLAAGDARLTIGTYSSGASASCEIELHAVPLAAGVDANGLAPTSSPRLGAASLEGAPTTDLSFEGPLATALIDTSRVQSGCVGLIGSVPDLALDITEPTIARLETVSEGDLVLVMQSPDGSYTCDDDDGMGNAPRIAKRLAPGHYPVWIGPFSDSSASASVQVGVRLTTIASEVAAAPEPVDLADAAPLHVTGTTGDELSAPSMWSDCAIAGYVRYEPDRTFRLAARRDVTIVSASLGGQPPLVVVEPHVPGGASAVSTCVDQGSWRGTLDAGSYDLFVGVASGDVAAGPYDLTITAAAPSVLPYTP